MSTSNPATLYVDLDGTLIKSDLLLESLLRLLGKNFFYLFLIPFWLAKGKANLKYQIAKRTEVKIDLLPYNQELLTYLAEQKSLGRRMILISASNNKYVTKVAEHVGLFSAHMGSNENTNLKGGKKLEKIRELSGDGNFEYAGNDRSDLDIWRHAQGAVVVSSNSRLIEEISRQTQIVQTFRGLDQPVHFFKKALRLHQWTKNLLLFIPLVLSHQVTDVGLVLLSLASFSSFSFCASSVYLLNDLLDLEHDRQHKTKCMRPFAAGTLSILVGLIASPLLLIASLLMALVLPLEFTLVLITYYILTLLYSFRLKSFAIVDVIILACLYTLRLIAGAVAISVIPSFWLLAFSMFLFLSLAIVKRYTELDILRSDNKAVAAGRGYEAQDLDILSVLGSASGFMAVLVFALYINSDETRMLYSTPQVLWFICPLLLYIICRIWLFAHRRVLNEDPVVFAISDRSSQFITLLCGLLIWAATIDWL